MWKGYLLGHAGKDVYAGYGEQWIQNVKSGDRDHPTRFKRHLVPPKVSQCSLLTLELFYFLGDEEVTPSGTLQRCNTRSCEEDEPSHHSVTLQQCNERWRTGRASTSASQKARVSAGFLILFLVRVYPNHVSPVTRKRDRPSNLGPPSGRCSDSVFVAGQGTTPPSPVATSQRRCWFSSVATRGVMRS
jgi:hypothetical protein